jgi:hypothetical protein
MTTKHKAEVLADQYRLFIGDPPSMEDWGEEASTLLRTIPAMEAEIEELRKKIISLEFLARREK